MRVEQSEKKEIGRIKLSDTQELIASLVDDEKDIHRKPRKIEEDPRRVKSGLSGV